LKAHQISKMAAGIMSKKRRYPDDANEVEADEQDKGDYGDMHSLNVTHASNGFSVSVHGKQSGDMPATNSQEYVFGHDHPVAQHIRGIMKHAKGKK